MLISNLTEIIKERTRLYLQVASLGDDAAFDSHAGGTARAVLAEVKIWELERQGGDGGLTPREMEVQRLVLEGHTSKEIAETLHISPRTVDVHRANIKQKRG